MGVFGILGIVLAKFINFFSRPVFMISTFSLLFLKRVGNSGKRANKCRQLFLYRPILKGS
jgi:hypothetical protein